MKPVRCSLFMLFLLLSSCTSTNWSHQHPKAESRVLIADPQAPLARAGHDVLQAAGTATSAIHVLDDGLEALAARKALITQATQSLDLQYYIWRSDETGQALGEALWQAAERGVRVRLLLDDWGAPLGDAGLRKLDSHDNIEVRIFNPLVLRDARLLSAFTDFKRVNRRMHNKALIADSSFSIVGGRNIGDEYFQRNTNVTFGDLDLLAVGAVTLQVGQLFDGYWNSPWAAPVDQLASDEPVQRTDKTVSQRDQPFWLRVDSQSFEQKLLQGSLRWFPATARALADPAQKLESETKPDDEGVLRAQLAVAMGAVHQELIIVSPYFIPGKRGVKEFKRLRKQGINICIVTNSLAATDVPAVHAGYARYRKALLRMGVELYEIRPDAITENLRFEASGSGGSSQSSLHAKFMVLDRHKIFVGSMNVDPRSVVVNNEMGLVVDNGELGQQLVSGLKEQLQTTAWRLELEDNDIAWIESRDGHAIRLHREPQTGLWSRLLLNLFSLIPENML